MKLTRIAFKLHRYLAYLMFFQLLAWIAGGALFAIVPFDSVTRSGAVVRKPVPQLASGWQQSLAASAVHKPSEVSARVTPHGDAWRISNGQQTEWRLASSGALLPAVGVDQIAAFARTVYQGTGPLMMVKRIDIPERRLLIVDELYGRHGVWQATFDDAYGTRLYFDATSGEFLKARNDYWVWFDFFWRLHVMDYSTGEDFNNWLLRIASVLALLFALSGLVLTWNAARREIARGRGDHS